MAFYYLNDSNQPVGPMDISAIRKLAEAGVVTRDVLVCEAGSEDWTPLSGKEASTPKPTVPKPPRTAPPPRSGLPPRRYTPKPDTSASTTHQATDATYPDWFPLASMIAGIVAIFLAGLPGLSLILAAPALGLGISALRQCSSGKRSLAITGIVTASLALLASIGNLLGGNPGAKYVGSWQNDMSTRMMMTQVDFSIMVTFNEDGRFTEVSGGQVTGGTPNTGPAVRMAGGDKTTGYWEWDSGRGAVVARHDGRNPTGYVDGANSDGRSFRTGPIDGGPSTRKAGEEFWVFKPDPNDRNALIGEHPTLFRHRTMRFYRLD